MKRIFAVDSHTGGEPTRVVVDGLPDLGPGTVAQRANVFREQHDRFRSCVVNEPRGSDILVGALLVPPVDPKATAGVIFFNNVGVLGMCGHGTIGLMVTLAHLGRIQPGIHKLETSVGDVLATLHPDGRVSVRNVPSYRSVKAARVSLPTGEVVTGDIAWGGNWFFLAKATNLPLTVANVEAITEFSWRIRRELPRAGLSGSDGGEIDHIELFGPPQDSANSGRNFVLCPGKAYDRSPCGTGTSAKLACLAADGDLAPGEVWRQESITGSVFEGTYEPGENGRIIPTIAGTAFITAETTLIVDPIDPLKDGIRL